MATAQRLRLGVLISGSGRTLQNFIDQIDAGRLAAEIRVVIGSRRDALGLARARQRGLPTVVVDRRSVEEPHFSETITAALRDAGVELVCMAGFLSLWHIPPDFEGQVMNVHPALLPEFGGRGYYGDRVHQAVLDAGCPESGCTVHFADNRYDHGPIILQRRVPVQPDDTVDSLAGRVFQEELRAYPEAVRLFAEGRLRVVGDRVHIVDG